MRLLLAAVLLVAPLALAQGGGHEVRTREMGYDLAFEPARLNVPAGAEVRFTPSGRFAHTLTATDGAFDTGNVDPGASGTFRAPSAEGEHAFFCRYHEGMRGVLVVEAAAAGAPSPPRETPGAAAPVVLAVLLLVAAVLALRRREV